MIHCAVQGVQIPNCVGCGLMVRHIDLDYAVWTSCEEGRRRRGSPVVSGHVSFHMCMDRGLPQGNAKPERGNPQPLCADLVVLYSISKSILAFHPPGRAQVGPHFGEPSTIQRASPDVLYHLPRWYRKHQHGLQRFGPPLRTPYVRHLANVMCHLANVKDRGDSSYRALCTALHMVQCCRLASNYAAYDGSELVRGGGHVP